MQFAFLPFCVLHEIQPRPPCLRSQPSIYVPVTASGDVMEIDDDVEGEEAEAWSVTVDKKVTPWGQGREGGKSRKGCRETVNSLE